MIIAKDTISVPEESLILVDDEDCITGYAHRDKCHQGKGLLHRAFSIFIFNEHKQLLIQKRSAKKLLWPLFWSNSVCSHPRKGESSQEACMRRLKEEIGLKTRPQFLFKFQYLASFEDVGSEREMCSVYIGKANGILKANRKEIAEWKYLNIEKLNEEMSSQPHLYTPWFRMEWDQIWRQYRRGILNL